MRAIRTIDGARKYAYILQLLQNFNEINLYHLCANVDV